MIVGHRVQMRRETPTDTGIDPPKLAPSEAFDMRGRRAPRAASTTSRGRGWA